MPVEDPEMIAQAAKIEALVEEIESFPDSAVREKMAGIVEGLLALYGEGLARMLEIVARQEDGVGAQTLAAFAEDGLIAHLLLLHDLHPLDLEERVARALEEVRPSLKLHGGNVELIGVQEGVAYLRLEGHCKGCPSSTITMRTAIEEAIRRAAPDLIGIEAEGVAELAPIPQAFVPLTALQTIERR